MDIKFDTLKYLVNNDLSSIESKEAEKEIIELNKKEKKFYKKRLLAVTKSLFKEDIFNKSPKSTQLVFESYIKKMIEIFKDNDLNEARSKEYEGFAETIISENENDETLRKKTNKD